jgi:predicted secreted protein
VQWQVSTDSGKTFHNILLSDTDTLTFTAHAYQNGDEFQAVFSNGDGTATTTAATLTVDFAPSVTLQPKSATVAVNSPVTLTTQANGNPAPSVQWQISTDGGKTYTDISGATSTTYTFTASATPTSDLYRVVFTSTLGKATSHAATVTVRVPPAVTANPTNETVNAGTDVTFTAAAIGTPAPRVQWQVSTNGGKTFHNIPFANTDALTFTARAYQNGDEFQAVFTNAAGKATTTAATLTVDFGPHFPHNNLIVAVNSQVTLTVPVTGNPAPSVQWQISSDHGKTYSDIAGATSSTYTFTAPSVPGSALYRAKLTNGSGTAYSTPMNVIVEIPPAVTTNPTSATVNAGTVVSFTAVATGTPAPSVQWQLSTDGGRTFHNIPLATTDTLTFTARAYQNGDEFQVVFTNGAGKATTTAATLTVDFAPSVSLQPSSETVAVNSPVTLTAQASGNPAPSVQWQISTDGGKTYTDISGATSTHYTFTASATPVSDLYRAVFTSTLGKAVSHAARVTVEVPPLVSANPSSEIVAAGTIVTFTAAATGTPAPHVQWQVSTDGGKTFHNIPFANTDSLTFTAESAMSGDEFQAVFTNGAGKATTTDATLTVT